ncbi:MAG: HAMP domain-containing sensor histidine kinase, partial [Sedimenticolaceae bacterium]
MAANLNAMLDEIQRLMEGIRHVSDNVAHDLRTPLTRLRNRLEGLRTELQNNGASLDAVERSLADTDQLLSTFSALLRIARIEAGGQPLRFAPVDLGALLTDAMELYEAVAEQQGLVLDLDLADCPPVMGDRDQLFQAVANLLDNAIKYTPSGGQVEVSLQSDPALARVKVSDSGPGIPDSRHEQVTERFYR